MTMTTNESNGHNAEHDEHVLTPGTGWCGWLPMLGPTGHRSAVLVHCSYDDAYPGQACWRDQHGANLGMISQTKIYATRDKATRVARLMFAASPKVRS